MFFRQVFEWKVAAIRLQSTSKRTLIDNELQSRVLMRYYLLC